MYQCMQRGWKVSFPFGDDTKYDAIVHTSKGLHKVQVKSCNKPDSRGRYRINMNCANTGNKRAHYTKTDCDFIAAFVAPLNIWYIIPVCDLGRNHLDLALNYQECLNAWDHLGTSL